MRLLSVLAILGALGVAQAPDAQTLESRSYRVELRVGAPSATLRDSLRGRENVLYRLSAAAGQRMTVTLTSSSRSVLFNVYAPGRQPGDQALATGDGTIGASFMPAINRFEGSLPETGDYTISVYLVRAAARRGDEADVTLRIGLAEGATQLPGDAPRPPAVGRPEAGAFLRVTGVGAGDRLNVRGGPSTANRVLFTLGEGDAVRNLGCVANASGSRWCEVERPGAPGVSDWAAARYLATSAAPGGATQLPGNSAVPGTGSAATGQLPCTLAGVALQCRFSVTRRGRGDGTLVLRLPLGLQRRIEFSAGRPVSSDAPGGIFAEWSGDNVIVRIGTAERYRVPDAVLFGG